MRRAGEPGLEERGIGGNGDEREANGHREQAELPEIRITRRRLSPARRNGDRKGEERQSRESKMHKTRQMRGDLTDQQVRIAVAYKKSALKEQQCHGPNRGRASEQRKHHLGEQGLYGEQE